MNQSVQKPPLGLHRVTADVCFQCNRCTAGCPLVPAMDLTPAQVVHYIILDDWDPVLRSEAIWACVHCETCTARCPQEVDVAGLMAMARSRSWREGKVRPDQPVANYSATFAENLYLYGRSAELPLTVIWKLKSEDYLQDMLLGTRLVSRGRLNTFPIPKGAGIFRRLCDRVAQREAEKR